MARVDFQRGEFGEIFQHSQRRGRGGPNLATEITDLYVLLQYVGRRQVNEAMQVANDLAEMHGVEAIRHPGRSSDDGNVIAEYLNTGETYDLTLLYDVENHAFLLTTYGDFVEQYEREHPQEDSCSDCGQMFEVSELDADTGKCPACRDRDEAERIADAGPVFKIEVSRTPDDQTFVWNAMWLLNEDAEPQLEVARKDMRPIFTTADRMTTVPGTSNRLYSKGALHPAFYMTKASVERALVELDRFLELSA